MTTIEPVPTMYKNTTFRSRLEARWAVFFDELGIDWEYEAEGYDVGGEWYLPDFYLPKFTGGIYAEVKFFGGDFRKAEKFVEATKRCIWLCEGVPDVRVYRILQWNGRFVDSFVGVPLFDQAEGENRFFYDPGYENEDGTIPKEYWTTESYVMAVQKANHFNFNWKN